MEAPKHLLISRTDSIGDVVLTLPLCGYLKHRWPNLRIGFICRSYTQPVVELSKYVDYTLLADQLPQQFDDGAPDAILHVFPNKEVARWAKRMNIAMRVGTAGRLFHWFTCNYRVFFTRKRSNLHEAQLNFRLLEPWLGKYEPTEAQLINWYGLQPLPSTIEPGYPAIVLHPKSKGSAVEWPEDKYIQLARNLAHAGCTVYFTGTHDEGEACPKIRQIEHPNIHILFGHFNLKELCGLLARANAVVACSTGPLHLAAALQTPAIGLYSRKKPIDGGRWAPLGTCVTVLNAPLGDYESPAAELSAISVEDVSAAVRDTCWKPR